MRFEVKYSIARDHTDLDKIREYINLILNQFVEEIGFPIQFDYKFKGIEYKELSPRK